MTNSERHIFLAAPRGFCAGVGRAIQIVERALNQYGAPVYVRHEIVHNPHVVNDLRKKGAVFVDELSEAPPDRPVIFSAHGVPKSVPEEAKKRNMFYIDATCPLVSKVHLEVERYFREGFFTLLIGHDGHPEVEGTIGQIPPEHISLIETPDQAEKITPPREKEIAKKIACVTQTTLSIDDTADIISVLKRRFPDLITPKKEDICYATTNRQMAVKEIAPKVDCLLVIGATNSSNSLRLVEVGKQQGCADSFLLSDETGIPWDKIAQYKNIGLTAGASAPEKLVEQILESLEEKYHLVIHKISIADENVVFKMPSILQ